MSSLLHVRCSRESSPCASSGHIACPIPTKCRLPQQSATITHTDSHLHVHTDQRPFRRPVYICHTYPGGTADCQPDMGKAHARRIDLAVTCAYLICPGSLRLGLGLRHLLSQSHTLHYSEFRAKLRLKCCCKLRPRLALHLMVCSGHSSACSSGVRSGLALVFTLG